MAIPTHNDQLANLINSDFQALPTAPITAPVPKIPTLECPPLPKRGRREYLQHLRKFFERDFSARKEQARLLGHDVSNLGNRAERRAFVQRVHFVREVRFA